MVGKSNIRRRRLESRIGKKEEAANNRYVATRTPRRRPKWMLE